MCCFVGLKFSVSQQKLDPSLRDCPDLGSFAWKPGESALVHVCTLVHLFGRKVHFAGVQSDRGEGFGSEKCYDLLGLYRNHQHSTG